MISLPIVNALTITYLSLDPVLRPPSPHRGMCCRWSALRHVFSWDLRYLYSRSYRLPPLQYTSSGNPSVPRPPVQSRGSQDHHDLNLELHKLDIRPDEGSSGPERGNRARSRGARSDSRGSSVASPGSSTSPLPSGDSGWIHHARPVEAGQYMCVWKDDDDRGSVPCGYRSKKHLVKRHVESKHLNIR